LGKDIKAADLDIGAGLFKRAHYCKATLIPAGVVIVAALGAQSILDYSMNEGCIKEE
jgi:hypothetical protein